MFHGLGQPITMPPQLFPTITSGYDSKSRSPKGTASAPAKASKTDQPTPSSAKSKNKKTRKKKSGAGDGAADGDGASLSEDALQSQRSTASGNFASGFDSLSLQPSWAKFTSSDSEFSETEGGLAAKSHTHSTKVRIAALSCFAGVCKVTCFELLFCPRLVTAF